MVEEKKEGLHDDYAEVDEIAEGVGTERQPQAEVVTDKVELKLSDLMPGQSTTPKWRKSARRIGP